MIFPAPHKVTQRKCQDYGRDDERGGGGGHSNSACGARHGRACQLRSAAGGRMRGRLAWEYIAQASGRGRDLTCKLPPLGRVGHVGCARSSMWRRALMSLLLSTSPYLCGRARRLVSMRARFQGGVMRRVASSGRRASGAGGAQGGAPQALRRSCCPWLGVFKLTSVGSLKVIWGLIS